VDYLKKRRSAAADAVRSHWEGRLRDEWEECQDNDSEWKPTPIEESFRLGLFTAAVTMSPRVMVTDYFSCVFWHRARFGFSTEDGSRIVKGAGSPRDCTGTVVVGATPECRGSLRLIPQFILGKYRADFLLDFDGFAGRFVRLVVECDGHDYHERTKEQARRDKARDRYIVSTGLPVFRFTGSELAADPTSAAHQCLEFLVGAAAKLPMVCGDKEF
jgi:very-short-patch-repair endonuclease